MTDANRKMVVTIFESAAGASFVTGAISLVTGPSIALAFSIATLTISLAGLGFMHITNVIRTRRRNKV